MDMNMVKRYNGKTKNYIFISIIIVLSAQIYFYPLGMDLRVSMGVVVFNIIVLMMEDLSEIYLAILVSIGVLLVRTEINIGFLDYSLYEGIKHNISSIIYYISYGVLIWLVKLKKYKDDIIIAIILLAIIDCVSNIIEAIIVDELNFELFKMAIIVAIIRSVIAYIMYLIYNKQKLFIVNREHQKRYAQLNVLISNIQAEMFYLKKSMKDIENVMGKSYSIYDEYKDNETLRERTLDIAREVHEIKKDYFRVLKGFENLIDDLESEDTMSISNIFYIIKENTLRYIKESDVDIKIDFIYEKDFIVKPYYSLFGVLNNLIVNSIDACGNNGYIEIIVKEEENFISMEVKDSGIGVEEDIIPYIFNPGFTTKYDKETGGASTGIGLAHVKNIIDELGGNIEVISKINIGTKFILKFDKELLIG